MSWLCDRADVPACTSDYLPTVLDQLEIKGGDDPISILPLILGRMTERPRPIAFESSGQIALSDNRNKIIYSLPGKKRPRKISQTVKIAKYDLIDDPSEMNDLAPAHPIIGERMTSKLMPGRASCLESLLKIDDQSTRRAKP